MAKPKKKKPTRARKTRTNHDRAVAGLALTAAFMFAAAGYQLNHDLNKVHETRDPPAADYHVYYTENRPEGGGDVVLEEHIRRVLYENKTDMLVDLRQFCITPDQSREEAEHLLQVWEYTQGLREGSAVGQALYDQAVEQGIYFCRKGPLSVGAGAQYEGYYDVVSLPEDGNDLFEFSSTVHEVMHGRQDDLGLLNYTYRWDAMSRTDRTLAIEAAAPVAEILVAFEKKQSGDSEIWDYMYDNGRSSYIHSHVMDAFEDAYDAAIAEGLSHDSARETGGAAAWQAMFDEDGWKTYYMSRVVAGYIDDLNEGKLGPLPQSNAFSLADARKSGSVNADINFTRDVTIPDADKVFDGVDPRMKQAYQALEYARDRAIYGDTLTMRWRNMRGSLQDNNPYMALDWEQLGERIARAATYRPVYEHMDEQLEQQRRDAVKELRDSAPVSQADPAVNDDAPRRDVMAKLDIRRWQPPAA